MSEFLMTFSAGLVSNLIIVPVAILIGWRLGRRGGGK